MSVQFWINGALAQTESISPYCSFGDGGIACTRIQRPAGSYTVQARVLSNGTEVARQAILINATGGTSTTGSTTTASLSWNPPTNTTGVTGYNVYVGTASGVYGPPINAGNVTSYMVNNLVIGTTYYFVVTGYSASGVESPSSNEVSKSIY